MKELCDFLRSDITSVVLGIVDEIGDSEDPELQTEFCRLLDSKSRRRKLGTRGVHPLYYLRFVIDKEQEWAANDDYWRTTFLIENADGFYSNLMVGIFRSRTLKGRWFWKKLYGMTYDELLKFAEAIDSARGNTESKVLRMCLEQLSKDIDELLEDD